MATYTIDGITYNDDTPHSRVERDLMKIAKDIEDGGGIDPKDIATDDEVEEVVDDIWP